MNLSRSTHGHRAVAEPEGLPDAERTSIIDDRQDELPCHGHRHVTHEPRRHGSIMNHASAARGMRHAACGGPDLA